MVSLAYLVSSRPAWARDPLPPPPTYRILSSIQLVIYIIISYVYESLREEDLFAMIFVSILQQVGEVYLGIL